ncbi:hypothetical protein [Streptomyces sp. NPDC089919]|uniref:hypothetical protein n=1 Tax=Streptomyces sp. NPDC089919 TaxID=3155188 RepID=UPI00343F119B
MESSEGEYFAFLSLTGDRFDAPGMPVETAREVGFLREAILKIARDIWLEGNSDRQRVPSGFNESFDLRLIAVESGSARPRMLLHRPSRRASDEEWSEWSDCYARARDRLTETLQNVAETQQTSINFSPGVMQAIRRVGSSLHDSETMILGDPVKETHRAVIDHAVRELLEEIEELAPTPEQAQVEGVIVEYDGSSLSFRVKTRAGISTCRLDPDHPELAGQAKEYLAADGITAPDVVVEGVTTDALAKNPKLVSVARITLLRSIEEKEILARLDHIAGLEVGWLGMDSVAPGPEVLEKVRRLVPHIARLGVPVAVIPNAEGAIVLEWRRGDSEMTAAIEHDNELFLCVDNTVTDDLQEKQLEFEETALVKFLTSGSMN